MRQSGGGARPRRLPGASLQADSLRSSAFRSPPGRRRVVPLRELLERAGLGPEQCYLDWTGVHYVLSLKCSPCPDRAIAPVRPRAPATAPIGVLVSVFGGERHQVQASEPTGGC